MINSILCLCIAALTSFFISACASDTHSNPPVADAGPETAAADVVPEAAAAPIIPDVIEFPQPTGSFTIVRGHRRTLIDQSRDLEGNVLDAGAGTPDGGGASAGSARPLSVEIWYPSDVPGSGATVPYMDSAEALEAIGSSEAANHVRTHSYANLPFASDLVASVLLFSPGYNSQPRVYTAFIEETVSRGYIVVAISHTLWTPVTTFADGSTIRMTHSSDDGTSAIFSAVEVWLADARFVLDEIVKTASSDPEGEIEGHADLTKMGMFGHSFGGSTSVWMLANDERVTAALDLDGTIYGYDKEESLSKPVFLFQEPGENSSEDNAFNQSAGIAFHAVLANSLHLNFSDLGIIALALKIDPSSWQSFMLGTIDPVRGVQEVNGYVQAFFDFALKGTPSPLLDGPTAEYPDVVNFAKKP